MYDLPPPTIPPAFYCFSRMPCSNSVKCRRLAGLRACLRSVTRQQLCSNGYQDNTVCVTLWFHEGLIDWDGIRRRRWMGKVKEIAAGGLWWGGGREERAGVMEWGRYEYWEVHAMFSDAARQALMQASVKYNHSDTWCLGWGQMLSQAKMHNKESPFRPVKLTATNTQSSCLRW